MSSIKSKSIKEVLKIVEEERNLLRITLNHLVKENEELKNQLQDMKVTVRANKDQLSDYISTITNKDKVVEKMTNTIEQLQNRLVVYEEHNKYYKLKSFRKLVKQTNKTLKTIEKSPTQDKTQYPLTDEQDILTSDNNNIKLVNTYRNEQLMNYRLKIDTLSTNENNKKYIAVYK